MNQNDIVTIADLNRIKDDIVSTLLNKLQPSFQTKKWLKSSEVGEILKVSAATLQTLRNNKSLPFTKLGKTFYYDYQDIVRILEENRSK